MFPKASGWNQPEAVGSVSGACPPQADTLTICLPMFPPVIIEQNATGRRTKAVGF